MYDLFQMYIIMSVVSYAIMFVYVCSVFGFNADALKLGINKNLAWQVPLWVIAWPYLFWIVISNTYTMSRDENFMNIVRISKKENF